MAASVRLTTFCQRTLSIYLYHATSVSSSLLIRCVFWFIVLRAFRSGCTSKYCHLLNCAQNPRTKQPAPLCFRAYLFGNLISVNSLAYLSRATTATIVKVESPRTISSRNLFVHKNIKSWIMPSCNQLEINWKSPHPSVYLLNCTDIQVVYNNNNTIERRWLGWNSSRISSTALFRFFYLDFPRSPSSLAHSIAPTLRFCVHSS